MQKRMRVVRIELRPELFEELKRQASKYSHEPNFGPEALATQMLESELASRRLEIRPDMVWIK